MAKRLWTPHQISRFGYFSHTAGVVYSSVVINHASPSGTATDESGFGRCQYNATCPNA